MLKVVLPDGVVREFEGRVRPLDVAEGISAGLARATVAAVVGENTIDAEDFLPESGEVHLRP